VSPTTPAVHLHHVSLDGRRSRRLEFRRGASQPGRNTTRAPCFPAVANEARKACFVECLGEHAGAVGCCSLLRSVAGFAAYRGADDAAAFAATLGFLGEFGFGARTQDHGRISEDTSAGVKIF